MHFLRDFVPNVNLFQCGECNKEFSCKGSLNKHNRNVHKINLKKESEITTMKDEEFY